MSDDTLNMFMERSNSSGNDNVLNYVMARNNGSGDDNCD